MKRILCGALSALLIFTGIQLPVRAETAGTEETAAVQPFLYFLFAYLSSASIASQAAVASLSLYITSTRVWSYVRHIAS